MVRFCSVHYSRLLALRLPPVHAVPRVYDQPFRALFSDALRVRQALTEPTKEAMIILLDVSSSMTANGTAPLESALKAVRYAFLREFCSWRLCVCGCAFPRVLCDVLCFVLFYVSFFRFC